MRNLKKYYEKISILVLFILLVSVVGCSNKSRIIKIATKPMTEQLILSEMLALLIEDNTDLKVEITKGVGGGTSRTYRKVRKPV